MSNLKVFVEKIFGINSTASTAYGSSLAVGSRATSSSGSTTAAADIIYKLRTVTANYAELINSGHADKHDLEAKKKAIEGYLLSLEALGQISNEYCNSLISELN